MLYAALFAAHIPPQRDQLRSAQMYVICNAWPLEAGDQRAKLLVPKLPSGRCRCVLRIVM